MNKFFISSVLASSLTSPADARGLYFQYYFKNLFARKAAWPQAAQTDSVDSPVVDETHREPNENHSPLYELAKSNPHVIAASIFTRKR